MTLRLTLALALLAGCPAPDSPSDTAADTAADTCDDMQARAMALVEAHQACTSEVGCELVSLYDIAGANNCFGAFQCHGAFPTGADLSGLSDDVASLTAEHEAAGCTDCRDDVACEDPESLEARCNATTGMCEVVER